MNDNKSSARQWKNPLSVSNAGADRLSESLLLGSKLRTRLADGPALGTFLIEFPCAASLSALALAGFDFVVLDMEHSPADFSTLEPLILAGQNAGLTVIVRTWGADVGLIGKVLDMGAHGIMAPHVASAERAREIVEEARFPPTGKRGFSPLSKFDALNEPLKSLGDSTFVIVQIEGREAIANIDEIAAVPGIDAVFVGPYDLALSLDVEPWSPAVYEAAGQIATSVPDSLGLGIYIDNPAHCGEWAARGFTLQCVSFDGRMMSDGARSVIERAIAGMKT